MTKISKIESLKAREILDSRGKPTVEVDLTTNLGLFQASVPSGVSKGKYEALEIRDGGKRYQGQGVKKAVQNVNKIIAPELIGKDPTRQKEIDQLMIRLDGTKNKSKLGVNAILPVSMVITRAGATAKNLPLYQYLNQLFREQIFTRADRKGVSGQAKSQHFSVSLPRPFFNLIEGGVHAGNELDFQEFLISPQEKKFSENLQVGVEIYQELKDLIRKNYIDLGINVGEEGGFAPPMKVAEEALDLILEAAKRLNYQKKIKIILDVAASQFFENGNYRMKIGIFRSQGLLNYYLDLIRKYPIFGIEDPFSEDDFFGWQKLSSQTNILVIGDDLLASNIQRIKRAKERKLCQGLILKLNQIGTVSEALEAAKLAREFGWKIIVSHRAGETNDDFISDLAVAISADFIKAGAPARGERIAKYNRLLRIEELSSSHLRRGSLAINEKTN